MNELSLGKRTLVVTASIVGATGAWVALVSLALVAIGSRVSGDGAGAAATPAAANVTSGNSPAPDRGSSSEPARRAARGASSSDVSRKPNG